MVEGRKTQLSLTVDSVLVDKVQKLKAANKYGSISDFFEQAGNNFIEATKPVTRRDVLIFIVYPWIISAIFFIWANVQKSILLWYVNWFVFALVIAAVYWFYTKWKAEQ